MIQETAGRKVLVTGGGGFLGSLLCERLTGAGSEVHATSRYARREEGDSRLTWWAVDMADLSAARNIFRAVKPDIVFHLAGAVGARPDIEDVVPTFHSLVGSTVNVLLTAAEVGCRRIILTGSLTEPQPAAGTPVPSSPYAAAKWAASAYGRMFHALYGTPVVVVRPFMTYGPGQDQTKLIPFVTSSLLKGEVPKLSSGRTKADWVFASDVIDAFMLAGSVPDIEGMTIDLGTGRLESMRDVVELLVQTVGAPQRPIFGALPDRPGENEIAADTTAAAAKLGWMARTSLRDGLQQTVAWYRKNGPPASA